MVVNLEIKFIFLYLLHKKIGCFVQKDPICWGKRFDVFVLLLLFYKNNIKEFWNYGLTDKRNHGGFALSQLIISRKQFVNCEKCVNSFCYAKSRKTALVVLQSAKHKLSINTPVQTSKLCGLGGVTPMVLTRKCHTFESEVTWFLERNYGIMY